MKRAYISLFFLMIFLAASFSFTNTYADWYGILLYEPSPGAIYFGNISDRDINIFSRLLGCYTFEYNANPRQPSILTSGFTFYNNITSFLPSDFKYSISGIDYNLSAKLLGIRPGNLPSEIIFGFGGSIGLNLESIELLVGSSNSSSDFTNVDFKHMNKAYLLNLLGILHAYVEIPLNFHNISSLMYTFGYNTGIVLYGPFLPNLESVSVQGDFQKTFFMITHSIAVRIRF